VARPRSNTWLWILNAIVISVVVIAAAAASTSVGHTVVSALNHFLLFYAGVLALVALTAEVGIGLVASDRIIMKPSARVTAQAIHRAMGFGAIAFLVIHIALEIVAGRSHPYDTVIPFLDKGKTFYLGLGTVASDMFIVIMMTGIYRARLATSMSPKAWRVIHASAYVAWSFGLVHGLLGGRAAKAFFGYSGFVYWAYGACAAAVAVALVMRLAAQHRASNEHRSQPVSEAPTGAGWPAAALASGALPSTVMSATAISSGAQTALEGRPPAARRAAGLGQRGRPQLALPAGISGQPSGSVRTARYTGTGQDGHTRQYSRTGPFDQLGGGHPSGPMPQFGADHPSGPFDRTQFDRPQFDRPQFDRPPFDRPRYERTGEIDQSGRQHRHMVRGQSDWIAAYERPLGAQRPVLPADHPSDSFDRPVLPAAHPSASFDQPQFDQPPPAPSPRYEMTGEIDRSALYQPILPADHPSAPFQRPQFDEPAGYDPRDRAAVPYQQAAVPYHHAAVPYQQAAVPYQQQVPPGRYAQPTPPDPRDAYAQYAQSAPPPQAGWPGQHRAGPDDPAAGYDPWERPGQFEPPYDRGPSAPYGHPAQPGPSAGHYDALDLAARHYEQRSQPDPRDRYAQYADPASQYGRPAYADPRDQAGPYRPAGDYPPPSHYAQPAGWDQRAPDDQAAHADRSAQFERDRAAHHASFADQDASYTRPRPPGARDHFGPQDDTDPLNIVPLNTGDYS
jgi:DMSO/TMAO reductase YedYZ heme-binding membrane subunit